MASVELFQFPGISFGRTLVARSRIDLLIEETATRRKDCIVHKYKLTFLTFSFRAQSSVHLSLFYQVTKVTETQSRSMNSQKRTRAEYPAILTEQALSIKHLLYGFWGNFSCGTRRVVPSGQDSSILLARVANHSAGVDSSDRARSRSWPYKK